MLDHSPSVFLCVFVILLLLGAVMHTQGSPPEMSMQEYDQLCGAIVENAKKAATFHNSAKPEAAHKHVELALGAWKKAVTAYPTEPQAYLDVAVFQHPGTYRVPPLPPSPQSSPRCTVEDLIQL